MGRTPKKTLKNPKNIKRIYPKRTNVLSVTPKYVKINNPPKYLSKRISPPFKTEESMDMMDYRDATLAKQNIKVVNKISHIPMSQRQNKYRKALAKQKGIRNPFDVCHRIPDKQVKKSIISNDQNEIKDVYNFHFTESKPANHLKMTDAIAKDLSTNKTNSKHYANVIQNLRISMPEAENTFVGDASTNRSISDRGLDLRHTQSGGLTPKSKKASDLNKKYFWGLSENLSSISNPNPNSSTKGLYL